MFSIFSTEERNGLVGNLAYAIIAQGIGLLSSILTSLVLPKVLGVDEYAYWQLFLMYSAYSGFALLGLNDGVFLRLGGKRYSEINKGELKAQQLVIAASQMLVAIGCLVAIAGADFDGYRGVVFSLCVLFGLLANLAQCLRYVFQCTNLTRISSIADFSFKGIFFIYMGTGLALGVNSSFPYIVGYVICQAIALLYICVCARDLLLAKASFSGVLRICASDIKSGLKIMVAFYADSLIAGFTRMLTDWRLGLAAFGKLSLSFSITSFVLGFIGQVSIVVFPLLKRLGLDGQKEKYLSIRLILHTVLPCAYLLYIPGKVVLGAWLPAYEESLRYLALTLPLCVYSCKANLLFNTYMKIERREGTLCLVNLVAMLFNGLLASLSIVGFTSIEAAACGIIATVWLRDLAFENLMSRRFGNSIVSFSLAEAIITVGFMASSWLMDIWSWPVVVAMVSIYLLVNHEGVRLVSEHIKRKIGQRA